MTDPSKKHVDGQDLESVVGGTLAPRDKPFQEQDEPKEKESLSAEQLANLSGAGDPRGTRGIPAPEEKRHAPGPGVD